jgi:hypothetical protein
VILVGEVAIVVGGIIVLIAGGVILIMDTTRRTKESSK